MTDEELRGLLGAQAAQIAALTAAISRGAPGDPLVSELWSSYTASWARETWAGSVRGLMKAPLEHFGDSRISQVTRVPWSHYRDEIRGKQITMFGMPPSPITLNMELARLKAMFNWAVDEELIAANPLARVKKIKAKKRRQTEPSDRDLEKLLSVCNDPLERAFVLLGWDCGMRHGEVRTVTWRQINLSTRKVQVYWSVAKNHHDRTVVLRQITVDALEALPHTLGTDAVFANARTRRPWSKATMWRKMRAAIDRAELVAHPLDGKVRFHDGRHHWMSKILRRGVRLPVAQKLSGHLSLSSAEVYIHVDEQDLEDARILLDSDRRGPQRAKIILDSGTSSAS